MNGLGVLVLAATLLLLFFGFRIGNAAVRLTIASIVGLAGLLALVVVMASFS